MDYQLIKQYVGQECIVTTSNTSFSGSGTTGSGTILAVVDGWIQFETKTSVNMINLDYVVSITQIKQKNKKTQPANS